jgi:hypothetical protein
MKVVIWIAIVVLADASFASSETDKAAKDCRDRLSVLYYPQYPEGPSLAAHMKLRTGGMVHSMNRSPGPFEGYVNLARTSPRKGFVEFPISYDREAIEFCRRTFEERGTCTSAVVNPLNALGLVSRWNPLVEVPTYFALYLYWRSLKKPKDFRPVVYGTPQFLKSSEVYLDLAYPLFLPLLTLSTFKLFGTNPDHMTLAKFSQKAVWAILFGGSLGAFGVQRVYSLISLRSKMLWSTQWNEHKSTPSSQSLVESK